MDLFFFTTASRSVYLFISEHHVCLLFILLYHVSLGLYPLCTHTQLPQPLII